MPVTSGQMGMTVELPVSTPELVEALHRDRESLVRDALLWQRWVRYAGLLAIALLSILFSERPREAIATPLAVVALLYVLCVSLTSEWARRARTMHNSWIPALLVTADVVALAAFVRVTGGPSVAPRLLIGALLVVQLAVFYFGWGLGLYAAVLSAVGYVIITLLYPQRSAGEIPAWGSVAFTVGVFALVCTVLITAYGSFRARMNRLRLFCKLVEDGDLNPALELGVDKRPDDLTLLAQSFDAMRLRLGEQIGTDPLTGCLNRRALETFLRAEWRQAKRRGTTIAVLAIDLDRFKDINDTYGHPFGDLVLQELAAIMRATARDTDEVARLGGDEFVVVLPDTGWEGALTFAERMRRKVDEHTFGAPTGAMRITISVGVALHRGTDPMSPALLLQEADRSLYKAKSAGRNRVFA
ncbi:MAG TPA: diguanylate cyclase [Gemmatimonadaceae bacterium]|nr:diguanylate cyclase [Gemmatimonadaceae bacterium]